MTEVKSSSEEMAESIFVRNERKMRRAFLVAAILVVLAVYHWYVLIPETLSTYLFVAFIVSGCFSALASMLAIFHAGYASALKDFEPRSWLREGEYRKIREEFNQHLAKSSAEINHLNKRYSSLIDFIGDRAPELFVEYVAGVLATEDNKTE